jgi:hypothetical protein
MTFTQLSLSKSLPYCVCCTGSGAGDFSPTTIGFILPTHLTLRLTSYGVVHALRDGTNALPEKFLFHLNQKQ